MPKTVEYTEGPKAVKNFESLATELFKVPKAQGRKTGKKTNERKSKPSDKD
jgi:hypothetical protein